MDWPSKRSTVPADAAQQERLRELAGQVLQMVHHGSDMMHATESGEYHVSDDEDAVLESHDYWRGCFEAADTAKLLLYQVFVKEGLEWPEPVTTSEDLIAFIEKQVAFGEALHEEQKMLLDEGSDDG
jgi:hypothetical protein